MITVFTPTYNRAYTLSRLYESLLNQTSSDFEWLIVDDGSTDNTEEMVNDFIKENKIPIRYLRQKNGGKHRAINKGVQEARGELFFIVDSDDYILPHAVERYLLHYTNIAETSEIIGVSGRRLYLTGKVIGDHFSEEFLDISTLDLRMKRKISGDMAEAYKTEILLKFPFPNIPDEKFCPEALIWNRMAQTGKVRFFNEGFYVCEYLEDGLTSSILRIRMNSPGYSTLYYRELYGLPIPFSQKVKAAVNYWRFWFCFAKSFPEKRSVSRLYKLPGYLMHLRDRKQIS